MAGAKILLVEGKDDEHVMRHVCVNRGVPPLDKFQTHGGIDGLLESFPVQLKASGVEAVGVVVDADADCAARWQALRNHLIGQGYSNVPNSPDPDGTVLSAPLGKLLPRVGVWIMPNNRLPGILEDFLRFLVPDGSVLFDHVKASVSGIPEKERRFRDADESKAIIHTWLAWQEEPGKPMGTAITARYLDSTVKEVDDLVSWLNRLFYPTPAK